jgi:hypothetical protein
MRILPSSRFHETSKVGFVAAIASDSRTIIANSS